MNAVHDLVMVAGHAPFKESVESVPGDPSGDEPWVLQSFQTGEPPLYIEHIRRGVELAKGNPQALLIFSGGYTRREAGLRWSEAATYLAIARHFGWIDADLNARAAAEDYSRDSFENLLFSLCRFERLTGRYPRHVSLVSWAFKRERFDQHRAAVRFPAARYTFEGFNNPIELAAALRGEKIAVEQFATNRYGAIGSLGEKRAARTPMNREHPFRDCAGLRDFFAFMADASNANRGYPGKLPWEA